MVLPQALQKGDKIVLIAPSGAVRDVKTVPQYVRYFERHGLSVITANSCYSHKGYLSASDRERADEINRYFEDKTIKAIFCVRGGYGSARILDKLDYQMIRQNAKIFFGFSDITALHAALNRRCGMVTFHGPNGNVASGKPYTDLSEHDMFYALKKENKVTIAGNAVKELITFTEGKAEGLSCGGNLTLISNSIGTEWEPEFEGKILFLEDVNEQLYSIDRMLTHLKQSRVFQKCTGVVFGHFTNCRNEDPEYGFQLTNIFRDALNGTDIPVLYNACFGHEHPMATIPMGLPCRIDTSNKTIRFLQSAVI